MLTDHHEILQPIKVWSRSEILSRDCPVPRASGVYAWYFRPIPPSVPIDGCITHNGLTLLYVGISPKSPPTNGRPPSQQTIRHRLKYHMRGNAAGSTLRLSLGCLLSGQLGIQLQRVGSGKRLTFADGEQRLSDWLAENAFVAWKVCDEPWVVEEKLILSLSLPLNLDQNRNHAFHQHLSLARRSAKATAQTLPIVSSRLGV